MLLVQFYFFFPLKIDITVGFNELIRTYWIPGRGTSGWQPREVINGEPQTCAVDTFSLGCVLYFCMSGGYHPFGIHDREANILSGTTNLTRVSPIAQDLISKLVEDIPSTRYAYALHFHALMSSNVFVPVFYLFHCVFLILTLFCYSG